MCLNMNSNGKKKEIYVFHNYKQDSFLWKVSWVCCDKDKEQDRNTEQC